VGPQAAQQPRQQHVALQVVGGDGQAHVQARGLETRRQGEMAQIIKQPARTLGQHASHGSRRNAPPGFHEQRIAGNGAQLVQPMADGRLRHPQALGGTGDRAFLVDHPKQLQQPAIQIQMIEIVHGFHD
jgi:hypothetical protein